MQVLYSRSGMARGATVHSLALFEKLGVHGGHFDEQMLKQTVQSIWQGLKYSAGEILSPRWPIC